LAKLREQASEQVTEGVSEVIEEVVIVESEAGQGSTAVAEQVGQDEENE